MMPSPHPDLSHTARGMRRVALAALAILSGCSAAPVQPQVPSVPLSAAYPLGGPAPDLP